MLKTLFIFILCVYIINSFQNIPYSILNNLFKENKFSNLPDIHLRELLNKLTIDLPNDLIQKETKGYIENLTIYNISLESLITTRKKNISNKVGIEITLRNIALNIKGKYIFLSKNPKNFVAFISSLTVKIPFYLVKNESGFITEVDTSGLNIDLEKAKIDLDLDTSEIMRNLIVEILKIVLQVIKMNVIEKNIINILKMKLTEMFQFVNNITINGVFPEELNISINESDRANIQNSPILGSASYLLSNLIGVNGSLNINELINLFTNNTGSIILKDYYKEEINFQLNLTNKNNTSFGNIDFSLNDLNISGLNSWSEFNILEPYNALQLFTHTNLDTLNINISFSLRIKLNNNSKLVKENISLFEEANFRTNLNNNKLNTFIQFPFNDKKANKEYTNEECLNLDCALDLIDSNGTGITSLSLKEKFNYMLLDIKRGEDLEEDLSDAFEKVTDLFISNFNDQIGLLINALINGTLINLVNNKLNQFLYSKNCPELPEIKKSEIDISITTIAGVSVSLIFIFLIFYPYILGKGCKKETKEKQIVLLQEENITELKGIKNTQIEAKYCLDNINTQWIKELGRTDPSGASLFLNPRVPIFFRIFIPFSILFTMALFASSNSGTGASVYIMLNVGRQIKAPSLFDFSLVNSVHDMWLAGSEVLSFLICVFSGVWPYLKLILMLISFCLPTSILSHKSREKILIILDATG